LATAPSISAASAPATCSGARTTPTLDKAARPYTDAAAPVHASRCNVHVTAVEGAPLRDWCGRWPQQPDMQVTVWSPKRWARRHTAAVDAGSLREQLGRLGNTPYLLRTGPARSEGQPFAPSSLLNQLRRQAVSSWQAQQARARS
jgi:putative protease